MTDRPYTITRKARWTVWTPDGELVSSHNEFKEADETAVNWCIAHPSQLATVQGPTYEAVYRPVSAPSPVPPTPTPEPTGDTPAIARWVTIPDTTPDKIEVAAFHASGIDRVEFGSLGTATQPDPVTGLYAVNNTTSGALVSATAYPKHGKPLDLGILRINPLEFPATVEIGPGKAITEALVQLGEPGTVILKEPGTYQWHPDDAGSAWWHKNSVSRGPTRYTVKAADGIHRDDIIIGRGPQTMRL